LVGKSEWKRPLGRRGCRWEYDIRMDIRKKLVGSCGLDVEWLRLRASGGLL